MTLAEQLIDYVNAACTGLWIHSSEPDEAEREIASLAREHEWKLAVWDVANGLRLPLAGGSSTTESGGSDPLAALRALPALGDANGTALLVLHNFHAFLKNPEVIQTTFTQLIAGKQQRTFVVVLAPVVAIPIELEKLFLVVEHALPQREQLERIARELTCDESRGLPEGEGLERLLDAAVGLTRYEAEAAFALSIARHGVIQPDAVWELKAQALKKNNLLTLHRGKECFADLGGLQALKDFCARALRSRSEAVARARGIVLLSPPGCGKSMFAKSLGTETGRPTLILDLGALYGSLVGATEANIRQALRIAEAMSPAILMVDELEKALSGVGSHGDSGVSTRLFGHLLTWLSDHHSDVFFVATCNDITKLPPEFTRAERFDGVFFVDLPTTGEKDVIWQMYRKQFGISAPCERPDDTSWTGAEIRSCCRLASLLEMTLTQAARNVVPVAITAAEQIEKLRSWASGRCLSASSSGVYSREGTQIDTRPGRRVNRNPSNN